MTCYCGHSKEEHVGTKRHPGSTACQVNGCDCIAYEEDEGEEETEGSDE